MTYREIDPEQQAAGERQLVAESRLDADANQGRLVRTDRAPLAEQRLVRSGNPELVPAVITLVCAVAAMTAAGNLMLPLQLAAALGGAIAGGAGCAGVDRLRLRAEAAWVARAGFPVLGYVESLANPRVTYAVRAIITLATIERDDRDRVLDLLGHLDTVDPTVTTDDTTIRVDALVPPNRRALKRFLRGLIEHVGQLHEARRVISLQLLPSTAAHAKPYDPYG